MVIPMTRSPKPAPSRRIFKYVRSIDAQPLIANMFAISGCASMLLTYLKIRRLGAGFGDLVMGITIVALLLPVLIYEGARHLKHALALRDGKADVHLGTDGPSRGNSAA